MIGASGTTRLCFFTDQIKREAHWMLHKVLQFIQVHTGVPENRYFNQQIRGWNREIWGQGICSKRWWHESISGNRFCPGWRGGFGAPCITTQLLVLHWAANPFQPSFSGKGQLWYHQAPLCHCEKSRSFDSIPEHSISSHSIWRFPEIGLPPVIIHFNGIFPCKPSILGYPHWWKPPYHSHFCRKLGPTNAPAAPLLRACYSAERIFASVHFGSSKMPSGSMGKDGHMRKCFQSPEVQSCRKSQDRNSLCQDKMIIENFS